MGNGAGTRTKATWPVVLWSRTPRRALAVALLAVAALLHLSGFGVTHHAPVGPLTPRFLDRPTAQQLDTLLWGPFAVLLLLLHCGRSC